MRMRHILLTSAASAGMFLAATNLPNAYAQKGTFLTPASQWAVTKVDGSGSADKPEYCAVARRYGGEAIMTIARNQSSETSFALDLQKPIFNQSDNIDIVLDPGAGEQREFSVSPVSKKAFVVKLGEDKRFFDAIERTGILRVEASEQFYVFNINDIDSGQTKLKSCLASASPAAPAISVPAVTPAVTAESSSAPVPFPTRVESNSNQALIDELNARIQSLETQNESLMDEISTVEQAAVDFARAPVPVSSLEAESLLAENLRLRAALQTGAVVEQGEKIRMLEAENKRLAAEANSASQLPERVSELQIRIEELLEDNAALRAQSSDNASIDVSSYEGDIRQLQTENESLRRALSEQAAQGGVSNDFQIQLQQLESENRALKERSTLDKQAAVESVRGEYQDQVAALEIEVRSLNAQRGSFERDEKKIAELQSEIMALRSENVTLQQDLIDKKEALTLASLEDGQVEALEARNDKLKAAVQKSLDAHNIQGKALKALEAENAALKGEIDGAVEAASAVDDLKLKLESLQAKIDLDENKRAHQEQKLAVLSSENESLKEKLQLSAVDGEALQLAQNDISLLKQEIAAKDATLANLEKSSGDDIDVLKKQVAAKDGIIEKLEVDSQVSIAALEDELNKKDEALQAMRSETQVDLASLQEDLAKKDAELKKYEGVPARLNNLLAAYKDSKGKASELEATLLASAYENAKENEALENKLAAANARNQEFEEKLLGLQKSVVAMASLNEEAKGLNVALAEKQKEIDSLKVMQQDLQLAQSENKDLKDEKDKLVLALKESLSMSEQKIAALEDARESDAEVIASLELQKDALKERNEAVLAKADIKSGVEEDNETLRMKLASLLDKFKKTEDELKSRDEEYSEMLAQNEALRGQLDLASEVIASAEIAKEQEPVRKVSPASKTTKSSVILASAEVPVPERTPPRKLRKRAAVSEPSIAEQLNAMMPAAGDEEDIVVAEAEVIETSDVAEKAQDFMERDLNQAQIYEEQLKRSLENEKRVQKSQADAIDVEELADDPVTEVIEKVAAPAVDNAKEIVAEPVTQVEILKEAMPEVQADEQADIAEVVEEALKEPEAVEVKMSQDPFEGIKEAGEDEVSKEVAEKTVVDEDKPPLPFKAKEPKSQPVTMVDIASVERVLKMAGVEGLSAVRKVNKAGDAYQWRAGDIYGSGEQRTMNSPAQFDQFVTEYLTRTEKRCKDDFAIVPDNSRDSGSMRVDSYEVACIGGDVSSSASLVFFNDGNTFTVLAHETKAEEMDVAMRVRDQIFNSLTSGRDS